MTLVHGVNSAGDLIPLLLDASGNIIIAAGSNLIGRVDSRNGDKIIGYSQIVASNTQNNVHAAGNIFIIGPVVPANRIWVVNWVGAYNNTTGGGTIGFNIRNAANTIAFQLRNPIVAAAGVYIMPETSGPWVLGPGEFIVANFTGTAINDDCDLAIHGYESNIS